MIGIITDSTCDIPEELIELYSLVERASLARTHKALVDLLYNKFFEKVKTGKNPHVAVLQGNVPAEAEPLAQRIHAEFMPLELLVNITGAVLGINTGPGALALCGYAEDWG